MTEEEHVRTFEAQRDRLTGLAYRMLGTVSDAEDIVQEAWLRWSRAEVEAIESPEAWLSTVTSRLCLDRLKSARVLRERYYGTWLPEPFLGEAPDTAETDESVSIALMLVLETLSPAERAGFLLHEVFGHSFAELAGILGRSETACRKLVSRARARVRAGRPRFRASRAEHETMLRRFLEACRGGDTGPLMNLLDESVTLFSDGGGKAVAVPRPLAGRGKVARFFVNITRYRASRADDVGTEFRFFNGAPGAVIRVDGEPVTALSLDISDGRIVSIYSHRNPDKLCRLRA